MYAQPNLPDIIQRTHHLSCLFCEQVHKAVIRVNGQPRLVVVKVRHPLVAERLSQDFRLLIPLAGALSGVCNTMELSLRVPPAQHGVSSNLLGRLVSRL